MALALRRGFFGIGLLALIGAVSCRQIAGIEDREVAPAPSCGPAFAGQACDSCAEQHCCAELTACAADEACKRAAGCIAACSTGDASCRSGCLAQERSASGRPLADVLACQARSCERECELSCGGAYETSSECTRCAVAKCCAASRACASNASCLARRFCRARCTDSNCGRLCDLRDEAGADTESALLACQTPSCEGECTDWSCLSAPLSSSSKIQLTLLVLDSVATTTPAPDVIVRRCRNSPENTCQLEEEGRTNGAGVAQFSVNITKDRGFDGYFELVDPQKRFLPELVFVAPAPRVDTVVYIQAFSALAREQVAVGLGLSSSVAGSGELLVHPRDCRGREGAGMHFSGSAGTEFYLRRSVPVSAARGATHTDSFLAVGGFFAVPPANYDVRGVLTLDERQAFSLGVAVRENTITFVDFAPGR